MEEIFVKEWFVKQLRQVFHVYPQASKHPVLEQYMHVIKNKWNLKLANAYSCTHDDVKLASLLFLHK